MQAAAHKLNTEDIWQEFSDQLYGFVIRRVNNHEDARDILQDIFLRVHSKKSSLKDNAKLSSWLYQLTRNAIIDYYRNSKKIPVNMIEIEADEDIQFTELIGCISPFLNRLDENEKELIRSTDLEGIKQKELALKLNLPYSTVKSKIQRARKKLKKMFLDCCDSNLNCKNNTSENPLHQHCQQCE
ncbi:sigma-70 family RNA polymerase sigma factor [Mangrovivirga sp. M17]|uniref:Sigma-70 family RNA polymerase sigma factor n=1 Tax=Mangrovivirga halotolerans TaxID=2993936 RepID=A0ABT3RQ77_9BACT|nr:sigma-70 family RNA polymerase sigma factor [Mangrovivirga halotolerans]MCX2743320.1 sigma-70 family RNA polymerase sigma factor [Mangrovivirga halotolerans]